MDWFYFACLNEAGDEGGGDGGGGTPEPAAPAAQAAEPAPAAGGAPAEGKAPATPAPEPLRPIAAAAAKTKAAKAAAAAASGAPSGAPTTPAAAGAQTPGAKPAVVVPPAAGGAPAAPVFTPKMTYKSKGQERKFPDWLTPQQIKDEKHEAEVRALFEKAESFDPVKTERDQARELITKKYEPMAQAVQVASHFIQQKDLTSFFEVANISEEDVIRWAIQRSKLTDAEKSADAQVRTQNYQAFINQGAQTTQQQDLQLQLVASRERELSYVLSQPERAAFVESFDARLGKGRFIQEVVRRGALYASGPNPVDVPVEQLVTEVMQLAGYVPGQAPAAAATPPAAGPAATPAGGQPAPNGTAPAAGQQRQRPPVIPNIQGSGASPAKKVIRNRSDLLAKRDELRAAGR